MQRLPRQASYGTLNPIATDMSALKLRAEGTVSTGETFRPALTNPFGPVDLKTSLFSGGAATLLGSLSSTDRGAVASSGAAQNTAAYADWTIPSAETKSAR
jgi:hypothetical protein